MLKIILGAAVALASAQGTPWSGKVLQSDARSLDAPTLPTVRKLAGAEAIEALIGNTFVLALGGGREYGAFYLLPNGGLRRGVDDLNDGGVPEFIHWVALPAERWWLRESDGSFCIGDVQMGAKTGHARPDYCAVLSISGNTVILRDGRNQRELYGTLLQGDARHLSPAATVAVTAMADRLVGNTVVLANPAEETVVYFQAGGTGRVHRRGSITGDEASPFHWLLRTDGSLCIAEGNAQFHEADCGAISIVGDTVTMKGPEEPAILGRILKGNAQKL